MEAIKNKWWYLIPSFCIVAFSILYLVAVKQYPGGSYFDRNFAGYSWNHNYLCNLLGENALNGVKNTARPVATLAVVFLCLGIGTFYLIFPKHFEMRLIWRINARICGFVSMVFAVFIYTDRHDFVLNLSGIFGAVAIITTLVALNRDRSYKLLIVGVCCALLMIANAYIYYSRIYVGHLPVIQKITLVMLLFWIITMNVMFTKKEQIENFDRSIV